ncbi:MAG: hypothetical protein JNL70_25280 [Saprospiraceae bacterium]|nr:hypothetical protein [Saprospiraceae bacterium]
MKKQAMQRMHNFPDAELYMLCMQCIRQAHRDIEQFKQYGYTPDKLTGFANQCEKFKNLPDDDELVGDQMIVTEKKYEAAEKLKTAIRAIMTRVEMKYSNRTGRYRKFGTAKMGDMTDAQLLFCGRRVARVARVQADFLIDVGVNENQILRVLDACIAFENAMNIQQDRIADRDIGVEIRMEQGNLIYQKMIEVCNIGKDIWTDKDLVKYDQYCIYESNNEQKKARKERLAAENMRDAMEEAINS